MATTAQHGFGCTLVYDNDSDFAGAVTVGQVESIGDFSLVCDDIEVTNHGSTAAYNSKATKEYIPGNIEGGEIAITCIYTETNTETYDGLLGGAAACAYWRITFDDDSYWSFQGHLKGIGMTGMTTNDALRFTMTIKVNGADDTVGLTALPTFTVA